MCGGRGKGRATYKNGRFLSHCFECAGQGLSGGAYFAALGAAGVDLDLLREQGPAAAGLSCGNVHADTEAWKFPSTRVLVKHNHRLLGRDREQMRWLTEKRGLSEQVIASAVIGWGYRIPLGYVVYTLPLATPEEAKGIRRVITAKWRISDAGWKTRSWSGHRRDVIDYPLYMGALRSLPDGALVVVEGEFDALCLQSHGIPAVSVTLGKGVWLPEWTDALAGRRVAVMYDVGAEPEAARAVTALQAAGTEAWVVPLGLPNQGDDATDWFVTYGRSARDMRRLLNRARRTGR